MHAGSHARFTSRRACRRAGGACGTPRLAGVGVTNLSLGPTASRRARWLKPCALQPVLLLHPERFRPGPCLRLAVCARRRRRALSQLLIQPTMLLISIGLRLAAPSAGASNLLFLLPCQVLASLFFLVWARPLLLLSIAPSETFAVAAAWHAYNAMCRPNVSHLLTRVCRPQLCR